MATEPRRIAITGYGGFVGSWLSRAIEEGGRDVALPILSRGSGDLRDPQAVAAAIRAARPDVVVHLAAIAAPLQARENPREAWDVNVLGTLNLATAVRELAPQARFLYIGSSEAYGGSFATLPAPLSEDAPFDPRNTYGATKAAADLMIGEMAHNGLRALRLRPFNHTGPGQAADYVVGSFARQIALIEKGAQPPRIQVGNLEAERDFLDVRDVVRAYLAAAGDDVEADGSALNIASGCPVRIDRILGQLLDFASVPIEIEIDPARYRPNDIPIASGNPERARQRLGWKLEIDLATTLRDTLNHWRGQAG
ncbi:GDP-6-deoxy-D-lyxo-4-hexulose reductase [Aureimonas endophytica]|uniref:GDP-6-deoxy-D-lyxo-4-hexulose reductase n=1 Tax=Aureimonas endophytica TaxID=2027858 RepID=A0A917ED93_9HYPH|nr:GDP-mannose 4,6-dehydratase [Aureimonas endophytica]GGE24434.1 GDP-6-deoxy-D-lyxo-4-hexulose reductase [Aureimonas endophytica]